MPTGDAVSPKPIVLESAIPLSQSIIWRLQRDYYARRGLKAWTEDNVPSYITNNPFIAEIYAGIVAGFIDDCLGPARHGSDLSPDNPLRILELGAGTGKFAYLFLRRLTLLLRDKKIPPQTVRYCLSDCSEELLAAWRSNRYLAEFAAAGILEFELAGAAEATLPASSATSAAHKSPRAKGPLVVIANYVFDSLPQDAFIFKDGSISEALITATGRTDGSETPQNPSRNPKLGDLQLSFTNRPVAPDRYSSKLWNDILERYRSRVPAATVFFPAVALDLLQTLGRSSDGRMLVLAADKGIRDEDDLALRQGPPELEFHASGQCFSALVNFDAMARVFWADDGEAFLPQKHFSNLSLCAFIQRSPGQKFPATRQAYREAADAFGPDDLFTLMDWLDSRLNDVSISQALAILRLTRWDPIALLRLFPAIAPKLRSAIAERHDLRDAVLKTAANRFPITPADHALPFSCGVILLELRFFAEASELFRASEATLGRSAATSYNLGLCAQGLGRTKEALALMIDACTQDPSFEPARNARAKLESQGELA